MIVLDRNGDGARKTAAAVGGIAYDCDVSREADIKRIVDEVEKTVGPIALFCSNAGIGDFGGRPDDATSQPNEQWQRGWEVNVMAHVYAARACLPYMIERGEGYFVNTRRPPACSTRSAIRSTASPSTPPSASPKFSPSPTATRASASPCCARRPSTHRCCAVPASARRMSMGSSRAEQVAQCVVEAIDEERFEILPHPQVLGYMQQEDGELLALDRRHGQAPPRAR